METFHLTFKINLKFWIYNLVSTKTNLITLCSTTAVHAQ